MIMQAFVSDETGLSKKAQVGIDLSICEIREITGGYFAKDKKAVIHSYDDISLIGDCWHLRAGKVYSLTFDQHIKLDEFHSAFIKHKSSLLRAGAFITSGVFDPGFESQIGATMFVFNNITIEKGALLAQVIIHENYPTEKYNGNYQKDKDLK